VTHLAILAKNTPNTRRRVGPPPFSHHSGGWIEPENLLPFESTGRFRLQVVRSVWNSFFFKTSSFGSRNLTAGGCFVARKFLLPWEKSGLLTPRERLPTWFDYSHYAFVFAKFNSLDRK
jgi:hypothetical protein